MRKLTTIACLLMATLSVAQCDMKKNEADPFTGSHVKSTALKKIKAVLSGRSLYMQATSVVLEGDTTYYLSLTPMPEASGCVGSSSYATFLWPDGTTERYTHIGKTSCTNPGPLVEIPYDSRIMREAPSAVRMGFTSGYMDAELKDTEITQHLSCVK